MIKVQIGPIWLELAEQAAIASIAFPAISAGAFGYPLQEAARIAIDSVVAAAPDLVSVRHVRFVLFADADLEAFERALRQYQTQGMDA